MKNCVRKGILGLLMTALTAAADAQAGLKVTPRCPNAGETVSIEYSNPARAGQWVTVHIDDGGNPPTCESVSILLDAGGNGSAPWVVPAWCYASFNAPDVAEVSIFIGGGSDDECVAGDGLPELLPALATDRSCFPAIARDRQRS
jgi:hypothetical protein